MAVESFAVGQRWLSESETELGLGMITQVEGRRLAVLFPATDEIRYYASHTAPLVRYQLKTDERGQHADGWFFTVRGMDEKAGILTYTVAPESEPENTTAVPETQLAHQVAAGQALTRFMAGKADRLDMYQLRQQAHQHLQALQQSQATGLLSARVQLLPHQLFVASKVADRYEPRVLLADEVGLGKTIEAGMIIQRRLLSGRSKRILIVVPENLIHQWLVELKRRFALDFSVFDAERCEQAEIDSSNPFDTEQRIIVSEHMLTHERWADALKTSQWDLLVVDEAHHLAPETAGFQAVQQLSEQSRALLLLTATPEQSGSEAHFKRLQLLDPARFNDFAAFQQEQQSYQDWAPCAVALSEQAPLGKDIQAQLEDILNEKVATQPTAEERQRLLDKLLDMHGTGRVMFRNSRQHVGGFGQRVLHTYDLPAQPEAELDGDMDDGLDAGLDSFRHWMEDVRIDWLLTYLKAHRSEKTVLICRSAEQVLDIAEALRVQAGIHAAVFHEQLSLTERDRAAAFFASEEDGSPILLCSEIGSEGRNFQFAQHLVLFDLPTHPDLLEQRIGRLDRIGQHGDINIHVPVCEGSDEAVLLPWFRDGMQAFEKPNAIGHAIYERYQIELDKVLDNPQKLPDFIAMTTAFASELKQQSEAGRDRLQELNACRADQAEDILKMVTDAEQTDALEHFVFAFFERFGIDFESLSEGVWFARPSEHMRIPALPGLPDDGFPITFSRTVAMHREDVAFMSWDHPLVRSALDVLVEDHHGSTCVGVLNNAALPAGTWFLELSFGSTVTAPPELVAQAFYPLQKIRVLMDAKGRELTTKVPSKALDQQCKFVEKKAARQLMKQLRAECQQLISEAWPLAEQQQQSLVAQAQTQAQSQLSAQQQRLEELQARNPSIRPAEIAAVQQRLTDIQAVLAQPQLSLDAIRLIVNVPT